MINHGEYFIDEAPSIIKSYAEELRQYIIDPLMEEGYTKIEAIMIHMSFQQRHLRSDVQELGNLEKDDWEK